MSISESVIRDNLISKLNVLSKNLTYIDKEVYLKNAKGTRGYIDILAKDDIGRYVIIELKRSGASSREALHETLKYFEGIKENKSLKDDEVVIYIVSTEWGELLVPFSKFVSEVKINIKGFKLEVNNFGVPTHAYEISPINVKNSRRLHKQCKICLYSTQVNREKGRASIESAFQQKGIEDYILVLLNNNKYDIFSDMPLMIYIATQELSEEEYIEIIKKDQEVYDQFISVKDSYIEDGEEYYNSLIQVCAVDDAKPWVYADYIEIGYPSKFNHKLLQDEEWNVEKLLRYGRFKNNDLLDDAVILDELKGNAGENKSRYIKNFDSSNNASIDVVKKELRVCLADNKIWLNGLLNAMDEIISFKDGEKWFVEIHNPMDTLNSIYRSHQEFELLPNDEGLKNSLKWIPSYRMFCESDEKAIMYIGMLEDNNNRIGLLEYFSKFYNGQVDSYFLKYSATGYNKNDINEARELGFDYANFKVELDKSELNRVFYKFDGYHFNEVPEFYFNADMIKFFLSESDFMKSLNEMYQGRFFAPGKLINKSNPSDE